MISSCCAANRANSMSRSVRGGRSSSTETLLRAKHCSRKAGRTGRPENDGGAAVAPEAAHRATEWRAARQQDPAKPAMWAITARTRTDTVPARRRTQVAGSYAMTVAYLGLGPNLGDARQTLKDAVVCLAQQQPINLLARASRYRTAPTDPTREAHFKS